GIDVRIPNMKFATVKQSPVFGGELAEYDSKAALAIKGVEAVIQIPHGVAVVADSTWHAMQGLEALEPKFNGGRTVGLDSQTIYETLKKAANNDIATSEMKDSDVVEAEYEIPYLHHAAMEPINCTAFVTENFCEMWAPTQNQHACMEVAKKVTGLPEEKIKINSMMMGGSFGRRLMDDYVEQALLVSKSLKKPVQVVWSREEDTRHGFYRPASVSKFRIKVDSEGIPNKWENQVSQENLAASEFFFGPTFGALNFDPMTIPGRVHDYPIIPKHFYKVDGVDVGHFPVQLGVPVGPWRAPPNSINVFYTESIMDELANAAGVDPLEYRLRFLHESPRHKTILEQVAKQANWGTKLPKGQGRGVAINDWFPLEGVTTVVAQVAEVSINTRGRVKINRVDCVVDCGVVVNPDSVVAQIEGSIIMGMSATLFEQITLDDGQVVQGNFDDYKIARMRDTPEINVTIVESNRPPSGSGEPATSPIVPAITNAIFAATGKRIRKLPIGKQKLV
ncbi:MAG: molybdopterin cofactor-binding domain-containing protein, partial [SAR324 cluster bacterium]|nr:molybdopterin cofactor-binding domain-containing protein [SAR324 cluster bacterium]